jgi:hypothetical protein
MTTDYSRYRYLSIQRDEGIAAGDLGLRLLCSLLPAAIRPADSVPDDWSWQEARDEFIRFLIANEIEFDERYV